MIDKKGDRIMTIQAQTEYTKEELTRFSRFSAVRNPAQIVIYAVLELCMLAMGLMFIFTAESKTEWILSIAVIAPLFLLIVPLMVYLTPFFAVKKSGNLIGCVNTYRFSDEEMQVTSSMPAFSGESSVKYAYLESIYETDHAFYLFLSKQQALILSKSGISRETSLQLRELFKQKLPGNKFISKVKHP